VLLRQREQGGTSSRSVVVLAAGDVASPVIGAVVTGRTLQAFWLV
jgi:hypothetical protein